MDFKIIKANIFHLGGIDAIERKCFPIPWSRDLLFNAITSEVYTTLVAISSRRVIGFGILMQNYDEAHIMNLAVDEKSRKYGVGSALMEHLIEEARRLGLYSLTLEVRVSNAAAIHLYEKYGFKSEGVRKAYYSDNHEDALIMWLRLDKEEKNNEKDT